MNEMLIFVKKSKSTNELSVAASTALGKIEAFDKTKNPKGRLVEALSGINAQIKSATDLMKTSEFRTCSMGTPVKFLPSGKTIELKEKNLLQEYESAWFKSSKRSATFEKLRTEIENNSATGNVIKKKLVKLQAIAEARNQALKEDNQARRKLGGRLHKTLSDLQTVYIHYALKNPCSAEDFKALFKEQIEDCVKLMQAVKQEVNNLKIFQFRSYEELKNAYDEIKDSLSSESSDLISNALRNLNYISAMALLANPSVDLKVQAIGSMNTLNSSMKKIGPP